jgi:hypothetical protein
MTGNTSLSLANADVSQVLIDDQAFYNHRLVSIKVPSNDFVISILESGRMGEGNNSFNKPNSRNFYQTMQKDNQINPLRLPTLRKNTIDTQIKKIQNIMAKNTTGVKKQNS